MKRRKKEIGLFNILGMGKGHIAKMMSIELTIVAIVSILCGLGGGVLFSKLMLSLLMRLLGFPVQFGFEVPIAGVAITVLVFGIIFFLTLLTNLARIKVAKPIELLYGGQTGEKEPKIKWPLVVVGVLALGFGYYIALVTEDPLQAIVLFFLAVLLVILGTYCLMTAGSIAVLKIMKKNKKYFYQTSHFTNVSGMLYRMKKNAVGLANICILSTMVLVMVSGTSCLFIGLEDAIRTQHPRHIEIMMRNIDEYRVDTISSAMDQAMEDCGAVETKDSRILYMYQYLTCSNVQNRFQFRDDQVLDAMDAVVYLIPLSSYNQLQGCEKTLESNEALVYSPDESYGYDTIRFLDYEYQVVERPEIMNVEYNHLLQYAETYYIVLPDKQAVADVYTDMQNALIIDESDKVQFSGYQAYYGFDLEGDRDERIRVGQYLNERLMEVQIDSEYSANFFLRAAEDYRAEFFELYGGLFFLGLFLGTIFIMATVLIMYYKQISEGFEDKERFRIMSKVGMSRDEIKKTIRSQVLSVFFLPLLCACIHVAFAFKMLTRLLLVLNLTNAALFLACTIGTVIIFAIIYTAVYALTARAYYRIVQ